MSEDILFGRLPYLFIEEEIMGEGMQSTKLSYIESAVCNEGRLPQCSSMYHRWQKAYLAEWSSHPVAVTAGIKGSCKDENRAPNQLGCVWQAQ